ncbi:GTP-binding protein [Aureisphaera galaxeae]|uniref:Rab family GTPase n=1 Tax=Aureisphaera galaxeae TaxID=1538023 RepID=UPI0023510086|nr:Rab family GTPase [Aureisphaera galaxeae]MDC8006007.1 GTP-binding protein [Aureisphaera galaxeae]
MEITKKVVLLGQFGVGKTSIARRYLMDIFEQDYVPTLGVQIRKKVLELPSGRKLSMIIWDLEGFSSVSKTRGSYLLGSHAFIYVFDVTRPYTYQGINKDIEFIKERYPKVILEIVGNKIDLEEEENINPIMKKKKIDVTGYVSAKTGEGIAALFTRLTKKLES